MNDSYWKEEVLPQKAFEILQNRCGGWGEGVSQYTRGSFVGFQELGILLSIYNRPLIRWFIAQAAWFPGIIRQKQKCRTLN